jgi:hypothetical protein
MNEEYKQLNKRLDDMAKYLKLTLYELKCEVKDIKETVYDLEEKLNGMEQMHEDIYKATVEDAN